MAQGRLKDSASDLSESMKRGGRGNMCLEASMRSVPLSGTLSGTLRGTCHASWHASALCEICEIQKRLENRQEKHKKDKNRTKGLKNAKCNGEEEGR